MEARLGVSLPETYKGFLRCSNGFSGFGMNPLHLRPVEEIDWFAAEQQDWIDIWTDAHAGGPTVPDEDYFVYGDAQDCVNLRVAYLRSALQISDVSEGAVYLLNPQVKSDTGEWEAWFFANWLPGAARFRSFRDLVLDEIT